MSNLSNYALKFQMNLGVKMEGMEMTIPYIIDAKYDEKSKIGIMNTSVKIMGIDFSTNVYTQTIDGKTITYTRENEEEAEEGIWLKKIEDSQSSNQLFDSIAEKIKKIKQKKSNDKHTDYYQVTIDKEQMQSLLNQSSRFTKSSINTTYYEIVRDVIVDLYVDKNTNYITKICMDLKDAIQLDENEAEVSMFTIILTFSEFNNVGTLTIPEEVIQNAIDQLDVDQSFDF